jgi:peptidylprolyl isomerase
MTITKFLTLTLFSVIIMFSFKKYIFAEGSKADPKQVQKKEDLENTLVLTLEGGKVEIKLFPDVAPNHVKRIKQLVRGGFYDGVVFHRVIAGFMAQTGDPTGTGMGGSGKKIDAEFSDISHKRGIVSMARTADPNSADSQFFICLADSVFLDGKYTVFGKVTKGMDLVDKIKKGDKESGKVLTPSKIISLKIKKDLGTAKK